MKKKLLALAIFAPACTLAQAQSNVQIYGLLDMNVEYLTNANPTKNSLLRLNSGGANTSRFGFRGTEDLGDGLKAVFQLEGGLKLDAGASDGDIFGRQANVGLEGNFGRVVAGRSFSTVYDFLLPFDPMGYAPQYSWATSAGASGNRKDGLLTGVSNMVKYQGDFNGFRLGANYAFGEAAGSTSDSAKYALALGYNVGALRLAAVYSQVNGVRNTAGVYDKTTATHLAAGYQLGDAKLNAGFRHFKKTLAAGGADQRSDTYWGGVNYKTTEAFTITGVVYYQDIKNTTAALNADPIMYVLGGKYAMSKRTDLYLVGAYAKAKGNNTVSLSRDDVGYGSSQTGVTAGIQHRF
ncbi:porin [Undibacterium terreum]|uniref:Porin n=1 Tax=Undibacterium terreum TaxID=1224302 RepID=A0A916UF27_9BURK|nr:porin [Undibacterium terreum]GGC69954.1 porin [Undibacterium terreum]